MCERACPVDCIKIDIIKPPKSSDYDCGKTSHDTQKKMIVPRFSIDMSECMYCDLCVHPCPEECIYMVGGPNEPKHEIDYEFSQYERHGLIYEFATTTEQDILDIGGETYLKERKAKEEKRNKGKNLEGIVQSADGDSATFDDGAPKKAKLQDPLLEIFNVVPDKVARGIAKKTVLYGKRSGFDFIKMSEEVNARVTKENKISDEMSKAIENLKNYVADEIVSDKSEVSDEPSKSETKTTPSSTESDFNVKSLDFIEDKMARGIAKKSFMGCKRAGSDINATIDTIISDLDSNEKNNDDIKAQLLLFKSSYDSSVKEAKADDNSALPSLFDIKLLNDIDDKMIRGSAKKIYMAGKRGNKTSQEVVDDILNELSDKMDDKGKEIIEGLK